MPILKDHFSERKTISEICEYNILCILYLQISLSHKNTKIQILYKMSSQCFIFESECQVMIAKTETIAESLQK